MKVKSIYIDKLKALKDFYIDFNDNVNILIGENGLGKTTILEAIYFMITASDINDRTDLKEERIKYLNIRLC